MDDVIESYTFEVRALRRIISDNGIVDAGDIVPLLEVLARHDLEKKAAQAEAEAARQEEFTRRQTDQGE